MLKKYPINEIKEKLEIDKVHITCYEYKNISLSDNTVFDKWRYITVFDSNLNKKEILSFNSNFAWNEEIGKYLINVRKKCLEIFGYDLIPLDYDMCGSFDLWDHNPISNPKMYKLRKIKKLCKKANVKLKYILCTYRDEFIVFIENDIYHEVNKKQFKILDKKHKYSVDYFEYFNINKDYSNRKYDYENKIS